MVLQTDSAWHLLLGLDEISEWMTELTNVRVLSRFLPSNLCLWRSRDVSFGTNILRSSTLFVVCIPEQRPLIKL